MSGPRVVRNGPLSEKEPAKAGLQKPKEDNKHLTQPIYVDLDARAGPLIPALGLQRNQSSSSCRLSPQFISPWLVRAPTRRLHSFVETVDEIMSWRCMESELPNFMAIMSYKKLTVGIRGDPVSSHPHVLIITLGPRAAARQPQQHAGGGRRPLTRRRRRRRPCCSSLRGYESRRRPQQRRISVGRGGQAAAAAGLCSGSGSGGGVPGEAAPLAGDGDGRRRAHQHGAVVFVFLQSCCCSCWYWYR